MSYEQRTSHPDDLLYWPDGDWCFACELVDMGHKSDDYQRISVDDPDYQCHLVNMENM